jgi:hypothetical protein
MICPHVTEGCCTWCEYAIKMHNAIVDEDCNMQEIRESARKFRGIVAKFKGMTVDDFGFIIEDDND